MVGLWGEMGFRRESPFPPSALPVVAAAARAITNRGDRRRIGRVLRHSLPAAPQRQRITALAEFPSQRHPHQRSGGAKKSPPHHLVT